MNAIRTEPLRGVLFADVSDSSRLITDLGNERARDLVLAALELAEGAVAAHEGRVVDRIGDEIFVLFETAEAAARGGLEIQLRLEEARELGELPLEVRMRIGFAAGPVLLDGDQVFGETVHLARRVATQAKPMQVLTTAPTLEQMRERPAARFVVRTHLKGQLGQHELFELLWDADQTLSLEPESAAPRAEAFELWLRCGPRECNVDAEHPVLTIGRDPHCELSVEGRGASRQHLKIEYRGGHFWIADQSTNGTSIERDGESPLFLHRDETQLEGAGALRIGGPDGGTRIDYELRSLC